MAGTATEYIQHHLTHLNNIGAKQGSIVDFSVFNFDTAVFSILMMLLAVWLMYSAAKKATSGVPGKWQCALKCSSIWFRNRLNPLFTETAPLSLLWL